MSTTQTNSRELELAAMVDLIRPFNSLSDLLLHPSVLSSESSLLTSELTSLCHSSHSTFLLLHNTASTLSTSFDSLSSSLDSLLATIPSLNDSTQKFSKTISPILEERRKATLVLDQHEKLADLLEIPALLDSCSRNGQYQDALELVNHATSVGKQFEDSEYDAERMAILRSLQREVEGGVRLMLGSLIETLKGRSKLPILYKAIGFLRELGGWNEEELAVLFLCCRGASIDNLHSANETAQIGSAGPNDTRRDMAKYLRGYIDIFREGVHDLVSAYTTIFLDHAQNIQGGSSGARDELIFLLSVFTGNQISSLMHTLSTHLPSVHDFTSLLSLLTQLNYCGTSFARIGLEFRPLLNKPFEQAVLSNIKQAMGNASTEFVSMFIEQERLGALPSTWLLASAAPGASTIIPTIPDSIEAATSTSGPLAAPQMLTFSAPLAILLNSHLTTFNSLRLLPILSLLPSIYQTLCESLATTMRCISDYSKSTSGPGSPTFRLDKQRNSISMERRNSEIITPQRRSFAPVDANGRPMSPGLQRTATPTSARPFSPTPRQGLTGEEMRAKQELERMNDADAAIAAEEQEVKNPFPTPPVYWTRYTPENMRLLARLREKISARRLENAASPGEETSKENDEENIDQATLLPGEELLPSFPLLELEPPRLDWILEEETYSSFGEFHPTKEIVQAFPSGIDKLYNPEPNADPRPHIRQLLVSLLAAYHRLLSDILEPVPSGYHGAPPEEIQAKLNQQVIEGQEPPEMDAAWPPPLNWEATILWMRTITLNLGWAVNEFRPVQARMNLESMMQRQIEVRREETRVIHNKCDELEKMLSDLRRSSASNL
ncbi:hypothetical protein FRC17_005183, partial [Serendipita sp. 399]